jgi:hypothetical protein
MAVEAATMMVRGIWISVETIVLSRAMEFYTACR